MPLSMLDETGLLAALGRALAGSGSESQPPGDLVVVRSAVRRRSTIYFVGVERGGSTEVRWVVKCPSASAERLGMQPPMSAAAQYAALQRLHDLLDGAGSRFRGPRPVALLPEHNALAMEWVEGRSVWDLVVPGALVRPQALRDGVRDSALALRHLHTILPVRTEVTDLSDVETRAFQESRDALASFGAPVETWFHPGTREPVPAEVVLLHGDWAPENVILDDRDRVFLLDPDLTRHGWPEHDLARFLLMLWDRPLFVVTGAFQRSALRHDLTRTFLTTYYGTSEVSPLLRPLLVREVAQRWAERHQDTRREGLVAGRAARSRLLRSYFTLLLEEVGDPGWPGGSWG